MESRNLYREFHFSCSSFRNARLYSTLVEEFVDFRRTSESLGCGVDERYG